MNGTVKADAQTIQMWANITKCIMCKHRKEEGHILPVKNPEHRKLQPNYSAAWLFHYEDTHGLPHDIVANWIMQSIYGIPLTAQEIMEEK